MYGDHNIQNNMANLSLNCQMLDIKQERCGCMHGENTPSYLRIS